MAPPVWTLMLLVGAAWAEDRVSAHVWRPKSPNRKPNSPYRKPNSPYRRQNSSDWRQNSSNWRPNPSDWRPGSPDWKLDSPDWKLMANTSWENSILSKCDFEDNARPLCDWSQMSADDGEWVRTTGSSRTGTSGPPGGYPNGEGYYLHMDASTFPVGGVARLRSPDIWEQGPLCVHFAFHMFGLSWGAQLRLLLLRGRKYRKPVMLWKHVNTQSASWVPTTVNVPADRDIPSWLMFEGMRGNTAYLDISLDGLSIQRGTCNRVCMSQICTFDTLNDLCGWSWVPTATGAKWTQKKGSSGKPGVGPDDDFSSPGSGYYMLLDSTGARPGQKAVLLSPLSHSSGCLTLSFQYIMRGQSPGEGLFVYATFMGNIRKHTLFSGHPGPSWQTVSVNYTGEGQIQFMVVGVFGQKPEPAVAVDSISIAPCGESFPQCNFEDSVRPFCDWNHVYGDIGHWSWGSKSVPTPISGPPREFPFGGEHYIYFDSVKLSQPGQSAKLVSPPFCAPGAICVEFAYHMYGLGEGTTFKLLLGSPAGRSPTSLWSRVGSQSSGWLNGSVTIPKGYHQPMQLFLEATRGSSTAFVIAVKFIFISHGPCRVLPQTEMTSTYLTSPTGPSDTTVSLLPIEGTTVPTEVYPTATGETTVPTEVYTTVTDETTVPTEVYTTATGETTVPTEAYPTATGETTVPTEVYPTATGETTVPTEVHPTVTEETTVPTGKITVSSEGTPVHTEENNVLVEMTTSSPEGSTVSTKATISFTEEMSTVPTEETTTFTALTSVPPGKTTVPTEVTTVATEVTAVTVKVTAVCSAETNVPHEETTTPSEATTVHIEVTASMHPEETATSTKMTTVTTEETAVSHGETSITPKKTTTPTAETTVPPGEMTVPIEMTTVPPGETSTPSEETTAPHEETSTLPEETTTPTEVTTVSIEETSIPTEQPTVTQQSTTCGPPCPSLPQVPVLSIGTVPTAGIPTSEICPPDAHFELCACPASCENPKPSCQSLCSPGCICNPGFLFSNNQCVNASSCNCLYNEKYYKPGEEWFSPNCTERCRCLPGSRMECQISQCGTHTECQLKNGQYQCHPYGSATCLIYGDLHFVTFDEKHIGFTGTCAYILTQTCKNSTDPFFRITADIQERGVEGISCLNKVFITLPEKTITFVRGRHTLIGDEKVTLPAIPSNDIFVGLSGRFVELRTTFGLRVRWDGDQQLFVTVSSTYTNKLCGFCGNYDGDSSNDNQNQDGTMAQNEDELGMSWQVKEEDKECQKNESPPSCDSAFGNTMSELCGQLVNPKGTFEACLLYIKASSFLDNCITDMCSFQGLQQKLCAHMSAMTAICQDAGYAVKSWREPEFCPLVCPQNSRYSLCANPCPDTCHLGSAVQSCQNQCVEACECDPGFVLSGLECVPHSKCGCTSLEGRYFKIQEQWFKPDCKELCTCEGNNNIRCQPWKCKAQEACGPKDGILGCHAQGTAICIASGDPHYLTFDGAVHHFMGTCTYLLTQPCLSSSQDSNNFVVTASNEIRDGNLEISYVKAVHVQVFDLKISLLKGRKVVLNNQRVSLPVWPSGGRVTIRLSGIFVLLYTTFGLQVRYDGKHLVEVTVPSSYSGSLCGLCGNYNNNSLDDNLRPDRNPAGNSLLLGNSWKILEASEHGCFIVGGQSSSCQESNMEDTWNKKCAILMNPVGPFSNCHEAVPPQASFSSCVYGQCGTKGDTLALCRSLQAYASLCAQAGQVTTWRNSTFCPLRCPPNSTYNPCANPCPATCLTLSTPRDCPTLPCVEGCECQKGHILSGTTCVPLRQCGCSDQSGSYHLLGESWYIEKTCTTLCKCSHHSNVTCSPVTCEANHMCLRQDGLLRCAAEMGECHVSEDSQIMSFDGHGHPIQDMCTYTLVKVCNPNMNLPFFTISAKTAKNIGSKDMAFSVYQLYIDIFSFRVTLQKKHAVLINDTLVTLPATTQIPGVNITTEDIYTIVTIKDEVQVKFESNNFLDIKIPSSSNGKVCGVCGNFNGDEEDELMIPSDELAQDEQEFMDSWKDRDIDPNCQKIEEQNIQVEQQEIMNGKCRPIDFEKAQAQCQTALQGPAWAQCASRVPLKPFLLGCMNSFCEFRELFRALCGALQSFEGACQNQGLKPPIWRNSSFCPLECPAHSHYTNCLPSCPPSCLDPDSLCEGSGHKVPATCREGCICQPGYVLNNDKCILKTHCGCKDAQGVFVPEGKNWISSSCTQNCVCIGGTIECQNFQCPSGAQCQDNEDGSSNCVKITLQCPAHSIYTNCLPQCPPSCSNLNDHCKETSLKDSTACKEGCLCNPGFVLDKDKCVPRIQCDCKDTQGAFIPAGKTWMPTDCTQSCTCSRGTIKCRSFQCPSGTYCKNNNDGSSNCTKITLQCPAHSQYTDCLPSCLPSCLDPDGHCEGTSTKAPVTCKEGCVCQPGYVLHKDKCMLKIECDCQDTQGGFIPAGKSWTPRGCTQNCTCLGGAIQCRNFQCPSGTYCKNIEDNNSNCAPITLQCLAHSQYTDCLPSCLPSCLDPEGHCEGISTKAPVSCKEGCVCQTGYVLHNDKCIPRLECDCQDTQGVFIPAGKSWTSRGCSRSCTCMGGAIQCQSFQCPSGTYCQDMEDGTSNCTKTTLKCPAHSRYTNCLPSCQPSCSDPEGHCEGSSTKAPSTCKEGCLCRHGFVLHKNKCMLRILCDCKNTQGVLIPADKTWINRGCTQTCICVGGAIYCRDFQCPSGTYCKDIEDDASNCTNLTLQCPAHSHFTSCLPSCLPSCSNLDDPCKESRSKVPASCKEGCICQPGFVFNEDKCVPRIECGCKNTQGSFIPAGKTWISRGCTQTCNCMGEAIQCQDFQCPQGTYCQDGNDGNSSCTKISLECPDNSLYTTCLPSCLPSCSDPDGLCRGTSAKAPSTCKEGCICQSGFVLDKDKCMLRTQCGCKDAQGVLIPADQTWINRGCTQNCTCMGGAIQCQSFQCPSGTYCKDMEDGNSDCTSITLQCPDHSLYTSCLPSCLPSCSNPDGYCVVSSTKNSSTCKEGCICQPDFVLHNDMCVLRTECGCRDAQGVLIPADKIWINRGCTQNCTCMGGVIQCKNFQCPSETYCKDIEDGNSDCTKITLQCPDHSLYVNCLPSCQPSCSDPEGHCEGVSTKAPSTCKEGCVCQPGFVLRNDKCVLRTECGCRDAQGVLIPADQTWINRGCTQNCTCMGGAIQCQSFQCPSGTYCKDMEDGNSDCTSITLQCPANSNFTNCLPSCQPSCSNMNGHCEGPSTHVSSTCKEGCVCLSGYVLYNNTCIPRNQCGCKDTEGAFIPEGKNWITRRCMQTCKCIGGAIHCRGFQCPQGTQCKDSEDGNSSCIKIILKCPAHSRYTNCLPSCPPTCLDPEGFCGGTSRKAPSTCKKGCVCRHGFVLHNDKCMLRILCDCKDTQGVLIPADKTWISRDCTETCTCSAGIIHCREFQCPPGTYCKNRDDGSTNCTKITLQCPTHSQFTDCLPSCLPSCSNRCEVTSPKVHSNCKKGCLCNNGFVFSEDKCVPRIQCDCKDAQGALIPAGKTWTSKGCTQSCACVEGHIQCQSFQCPSGSYCKDESEDSSICTNITLQCPAHSNHTSCLPSCLPSCSDPDGLCKGISPKVPSTCKEGCTCQPGYVLNNDKCIPRVHCGCKGAQGALIPKGKTWISRGCAQRCTCTEGTVQCQNFQCPSETFCKNSKNGSSNCIKIILQCPANSHYTDCLPSCPPSCSDPEGLCEDTDPKVSSTCQEGCLCHPGFVFHKDKCVPKIHCSCQDTQGVLVPAGKTWIRRGCTQSCTCMGGAVQCQSFQCPSGTYCKDNSDNSSNCAKIFLQCPANSHYTACLPFCQPSCTDPDGRCEGSNPKVPSICKEGCTCQHGYVLNNNKCTLRTECDCKASQGALIPAGKTWITRGCTQSCTCVKGAILCQSFLCPSGTYCKDSRNSISDCAEIPFKCTNHSRFTSCLPSCPPSCFNLDGHCEHTKPKVPDTCEEGCLCIPGYFWNHNKCVLRLHCDCKDAQGGVIPAGKSWTPRGCTQSCTCTGGAVQCRDFQCPSGTYCKDRDDGGSDCARIPLQCPAHSHFTSCLPSCLPSCSNLDDPCKESRSKVPASCKEGCICQPGYVLNNDKCVLRLHCDCKDSQGGVIPAGKSWTPRGCTQSCTCMGGAVQCQDFQCPSGTYCKDRDDGGSDCARIPLQCPAHSHFTSCLPSCLPSCSNLDDPCKESRSKVPASCKEGCICQPGYVLNNDKCVLRLHCDCKDAQGGVIPAGKSWTPRGCTQSCTCTGGAVQCRDFQCPSGTYCKDRDDGGSDCARIPLQCQAHSHFTSCLPSCLPSCFNLDDPCKESRSKVPASCKEGCICQPGYVLNNDKCVLRLHCDCKDAQGGVIPAGKSWTPRGCTQSCTCTGGAVQCRDFQCPSGTYCKDRDDGGSDCARIPLQCPDHSIFTSCLPSCLPSCSDLDDPCKESRSKVPASCKEGCICQPGYVLNNDKCVLRLHCDCKDAQGGVIPTGKSWTPRGCTQSCTCMGGAVECWDFQCPSGTYCKDRDDGGSDCARIPLQCPAHSHFTSCLPSCLPSCSNLDDPCKESRSKVPASCKEGCICQPGYVLNNDKCVLRLHCDCKDAQGGVIPAGKSWTPRGCTQSCTCTGGAVQCRDFQCPSGTYCKDRDDGGSDCARIPLQCPAHSVFTSCLPSCLPSCSNLDDPCKESRSKVPASCKEGCICQPGYVLNNDKCVLRLHCGCKDAQGGVIPAGKSWTPRGCTQSCTCTGGAVQCRDFQCPSGTYCKDRDDGGSDCARIPLQCPAHSYFTSCLPSCLPSCSNLDDPCKESQFKVPASCKEGCICQPGYFLNHKKCVLRLHCDCQDAQGGVIPAGKTWISRECTESCNCMGGTIQCRNFQCPSETYCKDNSDGSNDCARIPLKCPAHSHYTNCLPSCPPSCTDMDGRCEGTSPKVPSTCKEGCLCQPGYVLNNDKCVLQIHCDCRNSKGDFIPAGKTWIYRGCTQSCACAGGVVQCRNFKCPPGTQCQEGQDGSSNCTKAIVRCPAHSRYTTCLPSCLPSCSDPEGLCGGTSARAPSTCREGCLCRHGFVLHKNKCMLRILCDCKDAQGALIPADKNWLSRGCTQNCTCVAGEIYCQDFQCPSGTYCKDSGSGSSYCTKIALQCPAHSHFTSCLPLCVPSCSNLDGHCEGTSLKDPSTCKEGCLCQSGFVFSKNKCVPRIQCGCKDSQGTLIPAGKTWIATGCSQKCACKGGLVQCHNFECPSRTQCQDTQEGISNCAEIALQCPAHSSYTSCLPSCLPSCLDPNGLCKGTSPEASSTCNQGCICQSGYVLSNNKCIPKIQCNCKDAQGSLILAGKTWISNGCTQSCACMDGVIQCQNFFCPSGSHCQNTKDGSSNCASNSKGATEEGALQCPAHSHYTNCLPLCPPSCSDPDGRCEDTSPQVPATCKAGCICQPNYVQNNDNCVLRTQCGCKDAQGALIPDGKMWVSNGCTQSCTCMAGTVLCQDFQCPTGFHCQHNEDGSSSCATNALKCPAHSIYTSCIPSCLPSCSDPEGLCEGSRTKAHSTCREGCLCRSGYVLHNNKCVLRIHCACKSAQGSLIQTGQTWISTGCSQICTCKGGLFQCQKFKCPSGTQCEEKEDGSNNCVSTTLQCPPNSLYTTCLPSCLPSCLDPDGLCEGVSTKVPSTCREGCVCQPTYLLNKDKCVHRKQCGCKDAQGDLIPAGKTWISSGCTQSCACKDGVIQCQNFICPSGFHCQLNDDGSSNCASNKLEKCTIFGDPYYHTFDGLVYRFLGRMNYYLIKTVDKLPQGTEQLVMEGRNKISSQGSPALHELTTIVYGYKIQLREGLVVLVNDQKVAIPFSPNDHLRVILRAQRLILITDFELVVDYDGKHSAVISLPVVYQGLIQGLCGNYDKNRDNDLMLPSGMVISNVNVFGNSWEVKVADVVSRFPRALPEEGEEEEPDLLPSECSPEQTALISNTQACRVLVDPQGPFAACHQIIAPEPFEQHCMSDMCTAWKTKEEEELRCRVLSGYAIICQEAGANMTGWRDQTHCAMTCPANTVYQRCMTPCPASCAKFVNPKVCKGPCVEGCANLPGYIYSDTESLPETHCGCTANGIYYKLGDSFVTDDCSQHCTCASKGVLLCEPYACRVGESCTVANFTRGCFQDSPCLQNPCHNDGQCQEQGTTFICHCDLGYGGEFCTEPRDIPPRKKLESSSLVAILPGVLVMVLVPVLLPRVYVYMTTRTTLARRRGEKLLRRNRLRLEDTDVPEPAFKAMEF